MRKITDVQNTDPISGTYPSGNIRNKAGAISGSIINEPLLGDITQFFAKLARDTTTIENSLPDNEINGYQMFSAFVNYIRSLNATTSAAGVVEKATDTESKAGTADKYIDSALLKGITGGVITAPPIDIGDWNMDTTPTISVAHGLDSSKIRRCYVLIVNDQGLSYIPLVGGTSIGAAIIEGGTINSIGTVNVELGRVTGGVFDSTSYDSVGYNRGWIIIDYIP